MFQTGVPSGVGGGVGAPGGSGEPARPAGDVFPLIPGTPDPIRLAQALTEYEADGNPWLEEFVETGWVGPSPDEELEAVLRHERRVSAVQCGPADWDEPDESVELAEVLAQHPAAQVPARMPSVEGLPASSLLGLDEQPGELAGFGPITAATARKLAAVGVWRRILTDPVSGTVLDVGRTRYRPPAPLAEHIVLRDVRCVWPGCERPATGPGIDIDHILDWALGGVTADRNLGPFCEKHHVDEHNARWQVSQPEPGRFEYTSPTGHRYTREPEQVGQVVENDADPPPF